MVSEISGSLGWFSPALGNRTCPVWVRAPPAVFIGPAQQEVAGVATEVERRGRPSHGGCQGVSELKLSLLDLWT